MPDICLCIQIHQPHHLRRYTVFDTDENYFDMVAMTESSRLASQNCYLPLFALLTKLIKRHRGKFNLSLLVTGPALSLLPDLAPDAFAALKLLAARPEVHLIGSTSHHTIAAVPAPASDVPAPTKALDCTAELAAQIASHHAALTTLLGKAPTAFAGPELLYSNAIARAAASHYTHLLAPGMPLAQDTTDHGHLLHAADLPTTTVLPVNLNLSTLLTGAPLSSPPTAADLAKQILSAAPLTTLLLNAHAFGLTQPLASRPFDRLSDLLTSLLDQGAHFVAPTDTQADHAHAVLDLPHPVSDRLPACDLTHLLGNAMQTNAHAAWLKLGARLPTLPDAADTRTAAPSRPLATLPDAWRRLGSLDHFLHMSTLQMQSPISPQPAPQPAPQSNYDSPYDAYINFMNVLDSLAMRLAAPPPTPPQAPPPRLAT